MQGAAAQTAAFASFSPPTQPELRHVRAFPAVADQGSANRAGAALCRAQSAVSRSIHKLERELGVELHAELQRVRSDVAGLAEAGTVRNTTSVARRNR